MTHADNPKQEKNQLSRFGDTPLGMFSAILTIAPLASTFFADAAHIKSLTIAGLCWTTSHFVGTTVMAYKRISPCEAFAAIAVCSLAGAFTGAAVGHFVSMNQESDNMTLAAQNSKNYAHVPVQDSVAIRYPAERFCENTDIKPTYFPNGEIRKIMLGANGNLVSVQCQPPRFTPTR